MPTAPHRIKVLKAGPTYLRDGEEYTVTRVGQDLHFVHNSGSGTYERIRLWNALIGLGRVVVERLQQKEEQTI